MAPVLAFSVARCAGCSCDVWRACASGGRPHHRPPDPHLLFVQVLGACSPLTHVLLGQVKSSVVLLFGYFMFNSNPGASSLCAAVGGIVAMGAYTAVNISENNTRKREAAAVVHRSSSSSSGSSTAHHTAVIVDGVGGSGGSVMATSHLAADSSGVVKPTRHLLSSRTTDGGSGSGPHSVGHTALHVDTCDRDCDAATLLPSSLSYASPAERFAECESTDSECDDTARGSS